jgi:transposase
VSKARLVITAVVVEGRSPGDVARAYGVSRSWVYELVARYWSEGDAAFEPRSRRPKTSPGALSESRVERIVELRKDLEGQGLDAGPDTIVWHLQHRHGVRVSASTVARYLARRGLVPPQPAKRPKASYVRSHRWCAASPHWPCWRWRSSPPLRRTTTSGRWRRWPARVGGRGSCRVSVDGLIVAASMSMLVRRRAAMSAGALAWASLLAGFGASLAANVAAADRRWSGGSSPPGRPSPSCSRGICSCRSELRPLAMRDRDDHAAIAPFAADIARSWSEPGVDAAQLRRC